MNQVLFILITVAEEEAEKEAESKDRKLHEKEVKAKKETRETSPPSGRVMILKRSFFKDFRIVCHLIFKSSYCTF